MALWDFLSGIFDPVAKTIDELHTSDEEKETLRIEMRKAENAAMKEAIEYEKRLLQSRTDIIKAEAQGQSWLQRNWRPILMLAVVAIVVNNYILFPYLSMVTDKVIELDLPNGLWTLMTTGVTGYVVGRSGEKIVHDLKDTGRK